MYISIYFYKIAGVDDKQIDLNLGEKALRSKRELLVWDFFLFYFAVWFSIKKSWKNVHKYMIKGTGLHSYLAPRKEGDIPSWSQMSTRINFVDDGSLKLWKNKVYLLKYEN